MRARWGRDDDSFYTDRASSDEDREYRGSGRDWRGRTGSQSELSGSGPQGRYGNWDTSQEREPYRSGSYGSGSGSYGSGSGSGSYGSGSGSGSYGSGSGSGSYGPGSTYGAGTSYGSGSRSGYGSYGSGPYRSGAAAGASYSGRGPKGYTRSDDRIREDVCERLSENDEVDASDIEVQVNDRKVTLTGTVETRRMKHIAEDLAEAVSGVDDVDNRVTVRKPFFKDIADRVTGNDSDQHYANSGTKNSPAAASSSTGTGTTGTSASGTSGVQTASGRS
jgi:hypothetical protein